MNLWDRIINYSQKHIANQAHLQNICGTIATGLSCLCFTGSVLLNKGIPGEQKEFLVSQELADGAINVTLFFVLTDRFKKGAEKLIAAGKIFPETVKKEIETAKEELEKIKKGSGENALWNDIKPKLSKQKIEEIDKFHKGFRNTVSLAGSLLAMSIITPIVRNIIASKIQKKHEGSIFDKNTSLQSVKPVQNKPKVSNIDKPQTFQSRTGMKI